MKAQNKLFAATLFFVLHFCGKSVEWSFDQQRKMANHGVGENQQRVLKNL